MNLQLLDPFDLDYPDCIESVLGDCEASIVAFNKQGSLLAAGGLKGECYVWDFDTRGVARRLRGHTDKITSISWSRSGRYVLTSSSDATCRYWDLRTGNCEATVKFDSSVLSAQLHPRNRSQFIVVPSQHNIVLVDLFSGDVQRRELYIESLENSDGNTADVSGGQTRATKSANVGHPSAVCFNKNGTRLIVGTTRGYLVMIKLSGNHAVIWNSKVTSAAIKHIHFSRRGRNFVVNAHDRCIRTFGFDDEDETATPKMENKFQDLVNRCQWNQCCFSSDGDFVIGGSASKAQHNVYIWEQASGNLVRILEGPKEGLEWLDWHPVRPIIASVSNWKGLIYVWAKRYQESWSAFAPGFVELEENVEYEEKEDEFDILPEETTTKRDRTTEEEDFVDVLTVDKVLSGGLTDFSDAEDEDDGDADGKSLFNRERQFVIPIRPEEDSEDEENASLTREKGNAWIASPRSSSQEPLDACSAPTETSRTDGVEDLKRDGPAVASGSNDSVNHGNSAEDGDSKDPDNGADILQPPKKRLRMASASTKLQN